MIIHEQPVEFYINKLKNKEYFSFPGFSDAEWLAMEKTRIRLNENNGIGNRTGGGQLYTENIGNSLIDAFKVDSPNYYRAIPLGMYEEDWVYGKKRMELLMEHIGVDHQKMEFYERDEVTDVLASRGGIGPWIKQLREMDVVFVSNSFVRNIDYFLPYKHFIEIPKLDIYEEEDWLNKYSQKILDYGKPAVYVFAAGFAAAPLISKVHDKIPGSFFLDLGSIWDCFVGIGNQRGWRGEIYADKDKWWKWLDIVLEGIPYDKKRAEEVLEIGLNRERIKGLENG